MSSADPAVLRQLVEQLGLSLEAFGMPRMAGLVLGWLLLAGDEAVSLEELAQQLGVSKASVSHATRLLVQLGVLRRTAKPGTRKAYFRISDDPWGAMLEMEKRAALEFAGFAREALEVLGNEPLRRSRLAEMEEAFEVYLELLTAFQKRWKARERRT